MKYHLPEELKKADFNHMFSYCPEERHKVVIKGGELEVPRYQRSFLGTPRISSFLNTGQRDTNYKYFASYMFSGEDDSKNNENLPEIFQPYYDYVISNFSPDFNQVSINFYKDGNDYIAFHRDCELKMKGEKQILLLTFNEADDIRHLTFRLHKTLELPQNEFFKDEIDIPLEHGSMLLFGSNVQKYFKHGIKKSETKQKRISMTFRQFEAEE